MADYPAIHGIAKEVIQGKTTISEGNRQYDLLPSEIDGWIDNAKAGMGNALKTMPEDVSEQYERQLKELQEAYALAA